MNVGGVTSNWFRKDLRMGESVVWFVAMAAAAALSWFAGVLLGRTGRGSVGGLMLGVALLGGWAYLAHHPAVAVRMIPVGVLSQIEGVAAVPVFMFVIGIVWAASSVPRQRRVAAWAAMLGTVYFLQGGMWMLQTTPAAGFASDVHRGAVLQSQEYSCVPAACATALNMLGLYTSEAEMAHLTRTRPGTGATTIRAMHGLTQRLEGTPFRVQLLHLRPDELRSLDMPALTPLQFERTRRHMVTLLDANEHGVWIADPMDGPRLLDWGAFRASYTGQVLAFERGRSSTTPTYALH
jgi:hypothetical protein